MQWLYLAFIGLALLRAHRNEEFLQYIQFHPSLNITGTGLNEYSHFPKAPYGSFHGGRFTANNTHPGQLVSNELFPVPSDDPLVVEAALSFESRLTAGMLADAPLGYDEDYFYGHGTVGFLDAGSAGWAFQLFLTSRKVYAVYGRFPDQVDRAYGFMYAVPVANRRPSTVNTCAVVLSRRLRRVWYYVDGRLVLEVNRLGQLLSSRFQFAERSGKAIDIAGAGCGEWGCDFPQAVRVLIGNGLVRANAIPHTACQRTLLRKPDATPQCVPQSVRCKYNPKPTQPFSTFTIDMTSDFRFLNVVRLNGCAGMEDGRRKDRRCRGKICTYHKFYWLYATRRVMGGRPCHGRRNPGCQTISSFLPDSFSYDHRRRRRGRRRRRSSSSASYSGSGESSSRTEYGPRPACCQGTANAPWW
jgi:hypothetical protein